MRVGFGLTIYKAQGQTLKCVGIYLETACFGPGQLYVAASRVGDTARRPTRRVLCCSAGGRRPPRRAGRVTCTSRGHA